MKATLADKDKLIASLQQELINLKASRPLNYKLALSEIKDINNSKYTGSGVVIHVTNLLGHNVLRPVYLESGFSNELIAAFTNDIKNSLDKITLVVA